MHSGEVWGSLILPSSNLADAAIKKLVKLPLEHLSLHSDKLTPKLLPLLAHLSQLKQLELKPSLELDDAEALTLRASPALRRLQGCPLRADLQPHVHITQEVEMPLPSLTPHLYNPAPLL